MYTRLQIIMSCRVLQEWSRLACIKKCKSPMFSGMRGWSHRKITTYWSLMTQRYNIGLNYYLYYWNIISLFLFNFLELQVDLLQASTAQRHPMWSAGQRQIFWHCPFNMGVIKCCPGEQWTCNIFLFQESTSDNCYFGQSVYSGKG